MIINIQEAKKQMKAWGDHERTDRPVIPYNFPEGAGSEKDLIGSTSLNFELAKDWDGINTHLDIFEQYNGGVVYGDT